ncbi:MAG: metallophosphoesterase [Chthoniobacterales bacterium]|nr:metallophosphoesterase [Chthoniobacterales bacterium]
MLDEPIIISGTTEAPASPRDIADRRRPRDDYAPWFQIGPIRRYTWSRRDLPIAGLHAKLDGLRILHLSDVHFRENNWHPGLDGVIEHVQSSPPDLICITGDLVDDKHDSRFAAPLVERLVTQLRARHGIFAVLGNHDGDMLGPRLPRWGVRVIDGERIEVDAGGGAIIELLGIAGVHREDLFLPMFNSTVPGKLEGSSRIVLSHYPDALLRVTELQPDLFLAGHTHGGQICLPGGLPIITHDTLPRRFSRGVHRVSGTWVSISRGMGYTNQPVRLFSAAEIVELRLVVNTS